MLSTAWHEAGSRVPRTVWCRRLTQLPGIAMEEEGEAAAAEGKEEGSNDKEEEEAPDQTEEKEEGSGGQEEGGEAAAAEGKEEGSIAGGEKEDDRICRVCKDDDKTMHSCSKCELPCHGHIRGCSEQIKEGELICTKCSVQKK